MPISKEKLADIQGRLDNKLINPKDLSSEQRLALDQAFKDKMLTGYGSVAEMQAERNLARKEIAKDVKEKLAPLTPTSAFSLGLRRGTLVAAGDIVGSFAPYIMDGKKLATEARQLALQGKGVSYMPKIQQASGKNTFNAVSNLLTKLPGLRGLKAFQNTAKVLDGFANTIGAGATAQKLVTSQALRTELKSQALGATGAGAGSVTYDAINFPARFVAGANEDMAKIDQNQFNKMSPLEKTTYHAIENAKNALMWNAGAFGLFGVFNGLAQGSRKFFKLNPANQAKLNEKIIAQGLPISSVQAAEGIGGASGLYKGINQVVSVLPAAAGEPLRFQQKFTGAALAGLQSNLQAATSVPLVHTEVLAQAVRGTVADTYSKSSKIYGSMYRKSEEQYDAVSNVLNDYKDKIVSKYRGTPAQPGQAFSDADQRIIDSVFPEGTVIPFVYTSNLSKTSNNIVREISKGTVGDEFGRLKARGLRSETFDPLNAYIDNISATLAEARRANGGNYLTPAQFFKLRRDWNKNWVNTFQKSSDEVKGKVIRIQEAFEKDYNAVVKNPKASQLMDTNPRLAKFYNTVKKELGQQEADNFLRAFQRQITDANKFYQNANYVFGQSVNFYHNNKLANIMRRIDSNELTVRQALNIEGRQKFSDVEGMNALFKSAFDPKTGTSDGVKELYELMGGAKFFDKETQDRARYVMSLLMYRQFFDAFNKNAIVRTTKGVPGGAEMVEPFITKGADLNDTIRILDERSPDFRKTTTELLKEDMPMGKVSDQLVDKIKYQKRALTPDVIIKAIKDDLPITQEIFIKKEIDTLGPRAKPFPDDVVSITEKARQGVVGGRVVPKTERRAAQEQLEEVQLRLSGYQGFKFQKFADDIGITSPSGRQQLVEGFKIAKGLGDKAAGKHVENIETIIEALKKDFYTPKGDSSTYVTRAAIFALGAGGGITAGMLVGGAGGGILGAVLGAMMLKAGGRFLNSPKMAQKWLDLYTTGQRLDENAKKALLPSRQGAFADLFNYAFADDPDAPKISPGNIPEKDVIKYLQGETVQSVPTEEGLYEAVPPSVKERFNPDLKKLKDLKAEDVSDIESFNRGLTVANTRTDILDAMSNQQTPREITPQVQEFLETPSAVNVPQQAKQAQASIAGATQSVYKTLFPGDPLGEAIAGKTGAV